MVMESCPNCQSTSLNSRLDTRLVIQFVFAPPHTDPAILSVQLETSLIAEYNMLPLGNLDSEVGPGPVEASVLVSVGEQGFPHRPPCAQASLDQSGIHQRPGNPDSYYPLPLSSKVVRCCSPAVLTKTDQETIVSRGSLSWAAWSRSLSWSSSLTMSLQDLADRSLGDAHLSRNCLLF
mgnify:CR=1 FL=1